MNKLYTIKPHGDGYAIYRGRDMMHHGYNIGHLTEVTPATIALIENALNQAHEQAEKQEVYFTNDDDGLWVHIKCKGACYSENLSENKAAEFFVNAYRNKE